MYPKKFKPLIIVGRQRAGTRFLTNLLNSFDEVTIQGEVPPHVMEKVVQFIRDIDSYYAKGANRSDRHLRYHESWRKKREDLLFSIWEFANPSPAIKYNAKTRYFGYKRPNNELYFEFYEEAFAYRPPMYVYCIRNFVDNFLSVVSRWPERLIEDVANEYLDSVAQYHRMKKQAPSRVLLFNLDSHVQKGIKHVETSVIHPLGLKLTGEHRKKIQRMKGKNRTEEDLKIPRRKELVRDEQLFLDQHPELEIVFRELC
jgi:hypothetical protein